MLCRVAVLVAATTVPLASVADVSFVPTRLGALVIWDRSDGEVVAQALDEASAPAGESRTIIPAETAPRPAAAVAARGDGVWVVATSGNGWRAHRLDASGASAGAPWDLRLAESGKPLLAGDDRNLFVAAQHAGEVVLRRFRRPGAPTAERRVPLPHGHRLLGLVLRSRELHVASTAPDGRGLVLRTLPRSLDDEGETRETTAGARNAAWTTPTSWSGGVAALAAAGPAPIGVFFAPDRRVRVVEIAQGARDVSGAALTPWAGAGFAAWVTSRAAPSAPVAAVRALDAELSPVDRIRCARGFEGARLGGLLAGPAGVAAGWWGRTDGGTLRIAAARPDRPLQWIAGEHVERLEPAGRIDPASVSSDGALRLPGRRRPVMVPELASVREPSVAVATRRGRSLVAYTAVVDGRRRVRMVRVDRRGRVTPPLSVSGAVRVEVPVAVEAGPTGFVIRWLEERDRSVRVAASAREP